MVKAECLLSLNGISFKVQYPTYLHGYWSYHSTLHGATLTPNEVPDPLEAVRECIAQPSFDYLSDTEPCEEGSEVSQRKFAINVWEAYARDVMAYAQAMATYGVDTPTLNRVLSPFSHNTVLVASEQWQGFFENMGKAAHPPEIRDLVAVMWEAYAAKRM